MVFTNHIKENSNLELSDDHGDINDDDLFHDTLVEVYNIMYLKWTGESQVVENNR